MKRIIALSTSIVVIVCLSSLVEAATRQRGFPVKLEGVADKAAPVAADVDGDGKLELVGATRSRIHVMEADGSALSGFPLAMPSGAGIVTPLVIGVLGVPPASAPAGGPTLLFGAGDGSLVALQFDGSARPGFPLKAGSNLAGAPSLADLNSDGLLDIVFATVGGLVYAVDHSGKPLPGYPAKLGAPISSSVTVGRFDPKGQTVLIFGDEKGGLHAWTKPGKDAPGFPYRAQYSIAGQPVLGDVDDDGRFEIVFGSMDYKVHVVEPDGKASSGFPVKTGYRIYASCALIDLTADGVVDILASSGDGKLYGLSGSGKNIPGFPVDLGGRLRGAPVAADVDLDGRAEIAVGTDRNRLVLLRANGKTYPGFPAKMSDRLDVAPLLADLTGNGASEVIGLSRDGSLVVYRMLKKGKTRGAVGHWPCEGGDNRRTSVTGPNPARYVELKIDHHQPRTTDDLTLAYRHFDMDGQAEPKTVIRWLRNGRRVKELDGVRQVPASATGKHQTWSFTLQDPSDSRIFASPEVKVVNTLPGPPQIKLGPDPVRTGNDLSLDIVKGSEDVDGDKVRYRIAWLKDRRLKKAYSRSKIRSRDIARGQRWTVVVTPRDDEGDGRPARTSLVVSNTAPGAPKVSLKPGSPTVSQTIEVVLEKAGRDADGDEVSYHYLWESGGQALNLAQTASRMPAGLVAKHKEVKVTVTSFDGLELGGRTSAQVKVVNTVPAAPQIQIEPAQPGTVDDLTVKILKPAGDPDLDPVAYGFSWRRKGRAYKGKHKTATSLPAGETSRGERWTVLVTPRDDELSGGRASAEVTVVNLAPRPGEHRGLDARPATDSDLQVQEIQPPKDPDGDPAWTEVTWSRDGKKISSGKNMWTLGADKTRKHGRYKALLQASDGQAQSPARGLWFEVQNSPPGPCQVIIAPEKAGSGSELTARLTKPSSDADQDKVTMRYRWYKDGEPVSSGKRSHLVEGKLVKRGQRWTVSATPFDGEEAGTPCEQTVEIVNGAPSAPQIRLEPAQVGVGRDLELKIIKPASDPDGDPLKLSVAWTLNGRPFAAGMSGGPISAQALRKGQHWAVTVFASDGTLSSAEVKAEAKVANSAPGQPAIAVFPAQPLSSDDLRCRLVSATSDPDGDALSYEFDWFLESQKRQKKSRKDIDSFIVRGKANHSGNRLPAAKTKKGQRWACRASASDGHLRSGPAVAFSRVGNAAPQAARVRLEPENPTPAQELVCKIVAQAVDPDGDRVKYSFSWTKDGVVQKFAPETDRVPIRLTKANDIWQCGVVPSDGQLAGPGSESKEVLVMGR